MRLQVLSVVNVAFVTQAILRVTATLMPPAPDYPGRAGLSVLQWDNPATDLSLMPGEWGAVFF